MPACCASKSAKRAALKGTFQSPRGKILTGRRHGLHGKWPGIPLGNPDHFRVRPPQPLQPYNGRPLPLRGRIGEERP